MPFPQFDPAQLNIQPLAERQHDVRHESLLELEELPPPLDDRGSGFQTIAIDQGIAVEGAVAADMNGDGRLDLVVIGGRTNNLVWYENRPRTTVGE